MRTTSRVSFECVDPQERGAIGPPAHHIDLTREVGGEVGTGARRDVPNGRTPPPIAFVIEGHAVIAGDR